MEKVIKLKKNSQGWMAFIPEFNQWIPTPYTVNASVEKVIDGLASIEANHGFSFEVI